MCEKKPCGPKILLSSECILTKMSLVHCTILFLVPGNCNRHRIYSKPPSNSIQNPRLFYILYYYNQIDSHALRGYLSMLNFGGLSRVMQAIVESCRRFAAVLSQKSSISARILLNLSNFFPVSHQNCRIVESRVTPPIDLIVIIQYYRALGSWPSPGSRPLGNNKLGSYF
jgi:hypothetical protein